MYVTYLHILKKRSNIEPLNLQEENAENLTVDQVDSIVPEQWVMRISEEGGATTDSRSVGLFV